MGLVRQGSRQVLINVSPPDAYVGAPAANVVQSQTCDMPFERAMECGAYHREPVSLAKRTNRPSELGRAPKDRRCDGRPGNDPAAL